MWLVRLEGTHVTQQFLTHSSNSGKFEKRMVINRRETTNTAKRVIKFFLEDWRGLAGFISQSSAITVECFIA